MCVSGQCGKKSIILDLKTFPVTIVGIWFVWVSILFFLGFFIRLPIHDMVEDEGNILPPSEIVHAGLAS